ncbi:MAG: alpha/beta fold hydrolase, partial [Mycobacteriales bacterium]
MQRDIPLYTLDGVKDADVSTHYIYTEDKICLSALRFQRGEAGEAILIIHGLTTSTDMFIMPEHYNMVSYLLDHGYRDVWCLDYRMSNRHSYNLFKHRFTMDDVALYDYKPTLALMREHIGDKPIHVISHCLGANSFTMALLAKVVDGVSSVIVNSVSLTPRVPAWSNAKLMLAPNAVEYVLCLPYMNPAWGDDPGLTRGKMVAKLVDLFHRECDVSACHMLSLMWGTGRPALYNHQNLADVTHRRGRDLYGANSMNYYRHVRKMVKAGQAVK